MANNGKAGPVTVSFDVGVATGKGPENSSSSEEERETKRQAMKNVTGNPEFRSPSSRDTSTTGERMHRLHPAHARKMSESRVLPNSDRHYPPAARSSNFSFSTLRPPSRRAQSADVTSAVPGSSRPVYGHGSSSAASSATSIGMAISTAPTSTGPTPPASIIGDFATLELQPFQLPTGGKAAAATHRPRKSSFSDYIRSSIDTIRPPSNEPERSSSQAPSIRGRRLSKSKPRQPEEVERPASANRMTLQAMSFKRPTSTRPETRRQELDNLESTTLYSHDTLGPPTTQKPTKGKLSKNRTPGKDHDNNTRTASPARWSLFRRRDSSTRI
jgi:hypothetical protein